MPPEIKVIRLPYKVMIDAVIRRMVYTHYERISRALWNSLEFSRDICTAGSPKATKLEGAFLVMQERHMYCSMSIGLHNSQGDFRTEFYAAELR